MSLRRLAPLAIAAIAVLAVLAQVLRNDLVWDDSYLVAELDVGGGWDRLAEVVRAPFWDNSSYLSSTTSDYWRPLTSALLWGAAKLSGKSPVAMHLLSLLVALGAAAALARLYSRLAVGEEAARLGPWLALLFLAHPLCAEVLCLVSNLSDHLALAFVALALTALCERFEGRGTRGGLALAALAAFLACSSKEVGVVVAGAPLAAFLLARANRPGLRAGALADPRAWGAAVLPVALHLLLRAWVIGRAHGNPLLTVDPETVASAAALGFGRLLRHALAPVPSGAIVGIDPGDPAAVAIAACAWAGAIALVAGLPLLAPRWQPRIEAAFAGAVALLLLLSWIRIGEWRDDVTFYSAELGRDPDSELFRANLAQAQCEARAFDAAERTLAPFGAPGARSGSPLIEATYWNALAKIALLRDRDVELASRALERALVAAPSDLTNVLMLAEARDRAGRPDQALTVVRKALASPWFHDYRRATLERHAARYEARAARKAPPG